MNTSDEMKTQKILFYHGKFWKNVIRKTFDSIWLFRGRIDARYFSLTFCLMIIFYIVNLKRSSVFKKLFNLIWFWLTFDCSANEKLFSDFVFLLNKFNYKMKYGMNVKEIGFANGWAVIIFIVNCGYL